MKSDNEIGEYISALSNGAAYLGKKEDTKYMLEHYIIKKLISLQLSKVKKLIFKYVMIYQTKKHLKEK